ncbi:MAG: DUF393 domain-containing protein [Planctomycetota bacterium]|nr:DUF393 domain-containing protein [Planctomycetota bacterium]
MANAAPATEPATPKAGWVLYDGTCGICRRFMGLVRGTLERRGFALEPLQAPWVNARLKLTEEELLRDLLLLTADGALYRGADAYLYAMRRIWYAWPAGVLFMLPGLHGLFARAYRWFADNRYRFSGTCALPERGGD